MDRLSWYQSGESMEEILCQAGAVAIYDGELKQSAFEQGTISLTYQKVIWADSNDPDCRLILHHSLVQRIDKHHKSMFSRSGKIIVSVKSLPPGHPQGPVAASGSNTLRLVFRNGGEEDFYKRYIEALSKQMWQRTSSSSSSASASSSRNNFQPPHLSGSNVLTTHRNIGILGIEKRLAEQHQRAHEYINDAFEDMNKLMDSAREMVILSKNITERLRQKTGEITDDETIRLKSYLLSLGVSDPVTKSTFGSGALFYEKLATELATVLSAPLQECGGIMTLPEAYCRVNRARGIDPISPEDLLNSCNRLDTTDSSISLHTFDSGVKVLQLRTFDNQQITDELVKMTDALGFIDASLLAKSSGISLVLAEERLRLAEIQGKLCRDDTIEGLFYYINKFDLIEPNKDFSQNSDTNPPYLLV